MTHSHRKAARVGDVLLQVLQTPRVVASGPAIHRVYAWFRFTLVRESGSDLPSRTCVALESAALALELCERAGHGEHADVL